MLAKPLPRKYLQGMKSFLSLAFVLSLCTAASAADSDAAGSAKPAATAETNIISAVDASKFIGKTATVTGVVSEVHMSAKVVNINFEKPFPKQPFAAAIFSANTNKFSSLDKLKGAVIQVTGKITEYHDRPEIVLNSTNQLQVLQSAPADSAR
jgi:DNA/RNA endonuclease YhcR with UshA esterase domain